MQFAGARELRGARRGQTGPKRAQKLKRALTPGCCALAAAAPGKAARRCAVMRLYKQPGRKTTALRRTHGGVQALLQTAPAARVHQHAAVRLCRGPTKQPARNEVGGR